MKSSFSKLALSFFILIFSACAPVRITPISAESAIPPTIGETKDLIDPETIKSGDLAILSDGSVMVARKNYNKEGTLFGMVGPRDVIINNYSYIIKILKPKEEGYQNALLMFIDQAKKEARKK